MRRDADDHPADLVADKPVRGTLTRGVPVWDWPLRLWHWAMAFSVSVAWVTPNSYDRLHRIAGYVVLVLIGFRLLWGLAGTRHSRFRKIFLRLRAIPSFFEGLSRGRPGRYLGLNPAGVLMMIAILFSSGICAITGVMQTTVRFFGIWWVEDLHEYASDAIMWLAAIHVFGVFGVSILQRQNLFMSMIHGRKSGVSR